MLSQSLASFIHRTKYEYLEEDVVQFTKLCILDWLGSALAGSHYKPVQILKAFIDEMGGNPQASLVTGGKTSVYQAALVNGASSHMVELDDIHKASIIHAATVIIPAAVAVAEYRQKSGQDLITAVVVGYDVAFRIGEAVSPSHYRYWHNTATCGTFGAAAAAAKLLELDEEQIINTLGTAGTQAAGLWQFIDDGAMTKQLHPGKAAMEGVLAAITAQKGFTGAKRILEGPRGFFKAMCEEADESKVTQQLGEVFKIKENSFKIHASCRHTHQPIDVVLELQKTYNIAPADIRHIRVRTYQSAIEIAGYANPESVYASKFSIPYCVAVALEKGSAGLDDFNERNLQDPNIRNLMEKVEVVLDPEIEEEYPHKWASLVEMELNDGRQLSQHVDFPKGDPENPVTKEDLINKFKRMTQDKLSVEQTNSWVDKIMKLDQIRVLDEWFE
ncbi:2-methylcitrate dehydratase PrpD [Caldalkalibacillus uzonensis]|uniref:2-methylcitrate dehydratase PrpD n=1 Tax=Caldalkalibacillus uzonensis TaxID=353224 RepID=A0ABU0CXE4_9BACI|nr:MmgE/PrpD family protein [Caldalkalibacillus uzonensis]MDQ0340774.1 2-methylcitrate dehydratase PrpD [Caldalkalibacillus uzonensis]